MPALAQIGGAGTIQGTVADPTGAVIPGATVTATNLATGVGRSRQTTGAGLYVIAPLTARAGRVNGEPGAAGKPKGTLDGCSRRAQSRPAGRAGEPWLQLLFW